MLKVLLTLALVATASATIAPGCTTCPAGTAPRAAETGGCETCSAVANKHLGAVVTCTLVATSSDLIADPESGRKCAEGFFYTAPVTTAGSLAAATCTDCFGDNCTTCTTAASGSCTHANEGFYLNSGVPAACTPYAEAACNAQTTNQHPKPLAEVCPAGNTLTALPAGNDLCEACPTNMTPGLDADADSSCLDCEGDTTGVCTDVTNGCTAAATWTCTVTADSNTVVANSKTLNGTTKCRTGYYFAAGGDGADDGCTQCVADCAECTATGVAGCTSVAAGHFKTAEAIADCTVGTHDADCDVEATNQRPLTLAELCPAGNSHTTDPGLAEAPASSLCGACAVGTGKSLIGADSAVNTGCLTCATIASAANGATTTCDNDGTLEAGVAGTVDIVAAPAGSGDCRDNDGGGIDATKGTQALCDLADGYRWYSTEGRKCAYGAFYTAPVTTGDSKANASCTACESGCYVCTASTAGSCSVAKEGFWLDAGTPTACTPLSASVDGSCDDSATLKIVVPDYQACPFGNLCTGGPNVSDIDSTCPTPAPDVDAAGATAPGAFAAAVAAVVVALRM